MDNDPIWQCGWIIICSYILIYLRRSWMFKFFFSGKH
jgi:hypothetical protein